MKLSELNKLMRVIKQEHGDIDIAIHNNGIANILTNITVKETTAGNIALINFNNTRAERIGALGITLKTKDYSLYDPPVIPS